MPDQPAPSNEVLPATVLHIHGGTHKTEHTDDTVTLFQVTGIEQADGVLKLTLADEASHALEQVMDERYKQSTFVYKDGRVFVDGDEHTFEHEPTVGRSFTLDDTHKFEKIVLSGGCDIPMLGQLLAPSCRIELSAGSNIGIFGDEALDTIILRSQCGVFECQPPIKHLDAVLETDSEATVHVSKTAKFDVKGEARVEARLDKGCRTTKKTSRYAEIDIVD